MKNKMTQADVSPLDVLQYALGRIKDPQRRAAIESTRTKYPELWECLTDSETEQDHIDDRLAPDATEDSIPDAVDDYFAQLEAIRHFIQEFAEELKAAKGPKLNIARPVLEKYEPERFGGKKAVMAFEIWGKTDDGTAVSRPNLPKAPYVIPIQGRVYIAQREQDVPYGVVRIIAASNGTPLASVVRIMEYVEEEKMWKLTIDVTELFGYDVPDKDLDIHVQPARPELFAWFRRAEIERLASQLEDSQGKEHEKVQALLDELNQ